MDTDAGSDLTDALERLISGTPRNPSLAKKARLGKLRINPSTVSLEAGCSRTLIGYDGCAYQNIRDRILELKISGPKATTSFEDINRELRHENQDLREAIKVAMSRVAAKDLQIEATERYAERKVREAERRMNAREGPTGTMPSNVSPISGKGKRS